MCPGVSECDDDSLILSWWACDGQQTGKLPDKALIITTRHSRVITQYHDVLSEWEQASHHPDDNDDQSDTQCEWTLEAQHWSPIVPMPWAWVSLALGKSWWWRKLNHLLIEDDKEPTHLCYPQWSQSHTMTTGQSLNNPPNISCLLSIVNEISTHAFQTKFEKLSQEIDLNIFIQFILPPNILLSWGFNNFRDELEFSSLLHTNY